MAEEVRPLFWIASSRKDLGAFPEEVKRHRAARAGATWVLPKPFDGQSLIECLRQALSGEDFGGSGAP